MAAMVVVRRERLLCTFWYTVWPSYVPSPGPAVEGSGNKKTNTYAVPYYYTMHLPTNIRMCFGDAMMPWDVK
jgi:hypothetical protein